jgi:hypothetical protein
MQAMHGGADLLRLRTRVIGCAMAVALALSALVLFAPNARGAEPPLKTYLATGDSVTFGYSQQLFNENSPGENPFRFELVKTKAFPFFALNGYVLDWWIKQDIKQFQAKAHSFWLPATNNGCPGETTDSYIGNGPVGKALEVGIPGAHGEAPCAYKYAGKFPLHHEYTGTQSQLENALAVIKNDNTGKNETIRPVVRFSLQIGSNDLLRAVKQCEKEVGEGLWKDFGVTPEEQLKVCEEAHAGGLFRHILTNVSAILFAIRNGSAFGGVNYTGQIAFDGFYDPYGAVFTPGKELQPSSNLLLALLNAKTKRVVEAFLGVYANPQSNPGNVAHPTAFNPLVDGEPAKEPERLQKWTNMANFTEFEGKKNGPDIHPTPLGYEILATNLEEETP